MDAVQFTCSRNEASDCPGRAPRIAVCYGHRLPAYMISMKPRRGFRRNRPHKALSVRWQCALMGLARSRVYRIPKAAKESNALPMRRTDELYTDSPVLRFQADRLRTEGPPQGCAAADVGDGPGSAGTEALDQQPCAGTQGLSVFAAQPGDRAFKPGVGDGHPYVRVGRGHLYLVAIMDWASRALLS